MKSFICRSSPPVNFIVQQNGALYASREFRLLGSYDPALELRGDIVGPTELTLADKRHMHVYITGTNTRKTENGYETLPDGKKENRY